MAKPANELYSENNGGSIYNEANSIGEWYNSGATPLCVGVGDTAPYSGDYCIKADRDVASGGFKDIIWEWTGVTGVTYNISCYCKRGGGTINDQRVSFVNVSGTRDDQLLSAGDWAEYTSSIVADGDGTMSIRLYANTDSAEIASAYIDNISVREVLPTTTVKVEWTDSISAGIIGHKVYRDDVEIADVGMGVETYSDDTAVYGETYKYEVQAYTSTEETTDEVLGTNTVNVLAEIALPTNISVTEI